MLLQQHAPAQQKFVNYAARVPTNEQSSTLCPQHKRRGICAAAILTSCVHNHRVAGIPTVTMLTFKVGWVCITHGLLLRTMESQAEPLAPVPYRFLLPQLSGTLCCS